MSEVKGLSLPGQPTEEAIAEVGSEAGKSLVRGLAKLGNAYVSGWTATREAKAEAARVAIETASRIETEAALTKARRDQEVAELEHHAALQRRLERLLRELKREQLNLETVERLALDFTEADPDNSNARDIDEDWLFNFADYAQKVSDSDVQQLWARVLSSAAINGRPRLSAAALQTLSLFDRDIAEEFKKFVTVVVRVGFMPHPASGEPRPEPIDFATLMDLGVVRESMGARAFDFGGFRFDDSKGARLNRAHLALTKRGTDIANAVFRTFKELTLSEDIEQEYLRISLRQAMHRPGGVIIVADLVDGSQANILVRDRNQSAPATVSWKKSDALHLLSERLRMLLEWASQAYDVEIDNQSG